MPTKKGVATPHHKPEQRIEIANRVCQLYESQHATIASCCDAAGISYRTFALWCSEIAEIAERYKKAKQIQDDNYWQEIIRPLSKRAIQRHLEVEIEEQEKEVVYEGVKTGDTQKVVKWVLPNPTVTIFTLKGLYKEMFSDGMSTPAKTAVQSK